MFFFLRLLLSLRYSIRIKGMEKIERKRSGGFLFLPNHVALIDPIVLFAHLHSRFRVRPVVVEFIYRIPFLRPMLKRLRALSLPDFETSVNQIKTRKTDRTLIEIADGLKKGDNFLYYPSGKLKKSGLEFLQGNSGLHRLLALCPEANIVLIRTKGFWGSSFSKALTGASPDPVRTFKNNFMTLLKNGIFFAPRRKIEIEIEMEAADFPRTTTRLELNQTLENWFNRNGAEPLYLVSDRFWSSHFPQVAQPEKTSLKPVSPATTAKLYAEIRQILNQPELKISPEMSFANDLGMDSLNLAEFIAFLSQTYGLGAVHPDQLDTVQNALELAEKGQPTQAAPSTVFNWPEEKGRPQISYSAHDTLQEAFLEVCQKLGPYAMCADELAGVFTYNKAKQAILVLAQMFSTWPDTRVAIILPCSVGVYLIYMALIFAGKVPVMLNWTLGPRYLEEMIRISGAQRVLSSWRFIDKVSDVDFGTVADQIEFVEDLRSELTLFQKLKGAFLARCPSSFVARTLHLDPDQDAIILFTSGTEAVPKGVPLTHRNITTNQRILSIPCKLTPEIIVMGCLPPFHSFGFSPAGIMPWLAGLRVVYTPNPTDSYVLASVIERWKVNWLILPPSFFKRILQVANPKQLATLRTIVMGAEKVPQELHTLWKKFDIPGEILEGYGTTECSPVVTAFGRGTTIKLNTLPAGVGKLLDTFSIQIINPETLQPLSKDAEGEICLRGPSVFRGYLGTVPSPFIEIGGKQWYRTGDIGRIDEQGVVHLTDRLKRFAKIGGEMISLRAVEQTLIDELVKRKILKSDATSIAVCADEKILDKAQLVLFTTVPLDKEMVNEILFQSGFSRLIKISTVQEIQEIPLLANGKINYRRLTLS